MFFYYEEIVGRRIPKDKITFRCHPGIVLKNMKYVLRPKAVLLCSLSTRVYYFAAAGAGAAGAGAPRGIFLFLYGLY
jgi:hypothetical protein